MSTCACDDDLPFLCSLGVEEEPCRCECHETRKPVLPARRLPPLELEFEELGVPTRTIDEDEDVHDLNGGGR